MINGAFPAKKKYYTKQLKAQLDEGIKCCKDSFLGKNKRVNKYGEQCRIARYYDDAFHISIAQFNSIIVVTVIDSTTGEPILKRYLNSNQPGKWDLQFGSKVNTPAFNSLLLLSKLGVL